MSRIAWVSQSQVSLVERGFASQMRLGTIRAIGDALEIATPVTPRWRGADLFRLLDADHALLVEAVGARLVAAGWEITLEYTFNHYGERGSVDVLAWNPRHEALLLVEVKSRLVDLQDLFASMARKRRIVPKLVAEERGRQARLLGVLLVVAESTSNRTTISRHRASFASALPARGVAVRRWVLGPEGDLAGIQFLPLSRPSTDQQNAGLSGGSRRVRIARVKPQSAALSASGTLRVPSRS